MSKKNNQIIVETLSLLVSKLSETEKKTILDRILVPKSVPLSIFNSKLSGLSSLALYYTDYEKKSVKEISKLLNRNKNTIYTTISRLNNVRKLDLSSNLFIPISIFQNRKYSILESLVFYLRNEQKMKLVEIAKMLNKSQSTIKTVYWRYKKK